MSGRINQATDDHLVKLGNRNGRAVVVIGEDLA
jgi:hypothetical protein